MIRLSIITVCLNERHGIEKTCKSIVSQTWMDFEWIVIDGASTDGTLDVLSRYPVTRLVSEPDGGIYEAMNKGIRLARGGIRHLSEWRGLFSPSGSSVGSF